MNKLKEMRTKKKLSFRELSKLTGVSPSYLCDLESGKSNNPRIGTKILISKGLKTPVDELFFNE
ncbi:putative transcriptional regulator [Clostridium pasteurianum BC1]|uniref:Putative transcriptional regulator n=1 Tax=Clostridium pasteurianum BC1 TaxID=86416 RepID=R4K691_CLOPA|nr:putative transcriptional regulator [Clostridium pasteurianum BC1]